MKGNDAVIKELNSNLSDELTAIVQYILHSEMCDNWGYKKLAAMHKARAIEEMKHAETLIERIIFLDGTPIVAVPLKPQAGTDAKSQLEINLKDEHEAVVKYNKASQLSREKGDNGSREIFEKLLHDEEAHTDLLETQLSTIEAIGIANYLSEQMKG